MSSPSLPLLPSPEAHPLDYPLSLSPHTPPSDAVSAVSVTPTPTLLLLTRDRHGSFTLSNATSEATTAALPPPPVGAENLPLRPSSSLHSLMSAYKPPVVFGARQPTSSEVASEMVSRGSYVKRVEETMVEELLLETTQAFPSSSPTAEMAANITLDSFRLESSHSNGASQNRRVQPQRVVRPSFQLETSPRTNKSDSIETVEVYDPKLRKIVSYDIMSSSSLRSPIKTSPLRQQLASIALYPVTPLQSPGSPRPAASYTPSGSFAATSISAPSALAEDHEVAHSLMRFPLFTGLGDTLTSQSTHSTRGGASVRSHKKSGDEIMTPRETPAATPTVMPQSGPPHMLRNKSGTTAESTTREVSGMQGSLLADSPSRISEGISFVFPPLSPLTSIGAAAAVYSAEEVVAPSRSIPRSPAEVREATRHPGSTTRRRSGMASSVSEIVADPAFLPVGAVSSSSRTQSIPSVQLSPAMSRHLYRFSHDGTPVMESLTLPERSRMSTLSAIAPADSLNNTHVNVPMDPAHAKSYARSVGAVLPPLSPHVSYTNVHEMHLPPTARAASAIRPSEASSASRTNAPTFKQADATGPRPPLLGRLFREPKMHKQRVWVSTGSDNPSSPPSGEKQGEQA